MNDLIGMTRKPGRVYEPAVIKSCKQCLRLLRAVSHESVWHLWRCRVQPLLSLWVVPFFRYRHLFSNTENSNLLQQQPWRLSVHYFQHPLRFFRTFQLIKVIERRGATCWSHWSLGWRGEPRHRVLYISWPRKFQDPVQRNITDIMHIHQTLYPTVM